MNSDLYIKYLSKELTFLEQSLPKEESNLINKYFKDAGLFNVLKVHHYKYWTRQIFDLIDNFAIKDAELFDLGCGVGVFTIYALIKGINVTAIDIDPISTNILKKRYELLKLNFKNIGELSVDTLDVEDYPFNKKFDCGISIFSLLMMPNPKETFIKLFNSCNKTIIATGNVDAPLSKLIRNRGFLPREKKAKVLNIIENIYTSNNSNSISVKPLFMTSCHLPYLSSLIRKFLPALYYSAVLIESKR